MSLQVVGAGVGRTGTNSLKVALETLLGAPCYHMVETFGKPDHVEQWVKAARGETPDWDLLFAGYRAAVDWPAAAYYEQLMARYPDALVLLSVREDADAWWASADATIFQVLGRVSGDPPPMEGAILQMFARTFTPDWRNRDAAIAAYLAHNDRVRATVPPGRLLEYTTGDGWEPICEGLGLAVPESPFPHVNTTAEFRSFTGLDELAPVRRATSSRTVRDARRSPIRHEQERG